MSRKLLYIILGILLPWLSSCVRENAYAPDFIGGEDNPITVSFVLSTRDAMTRAENDITWGDEYEKPLDNDFENQIKNLALIIYNGDTKVVTITDFNYFAMAGATDDGCAESYIITAEITDQIGEAGGEYSFVVVANADLSETDADLSETDAENITYELSQIENDGIPMWGAVTKTVSANSNVDLGTIHLLRAVAKVEIKLSNDVDAEFDIERAVVTKYNSKGYVFPGLVNDESEAINYNSTLNLNHAENTFNALYDGDLLSTGLEFVVAEDKKTCYVYITEWKAIAENAKIALQFSDDNKPYEIEFKNYEGGKPVGDPHNIVRNHHYKYTITKVNTGASLELTCAVQPWTLKEESWDYTDVPAVGTGGNISWNIQTNGNRVVFPLISSYADFTFGLSSPASATWRVEFVTNKGKQNAFQLTKVINGVEQISDVPNYYMTGNIGEKVTLRVRPTSSAIDENNEANLRILVVLSDGRIIRVSEFLDEERDEEGDITKEGQEYIMVQTP